MQTTTRWIGAALLVAGLALSGCTAAPAAEAGGDSPATVEKVNGSGPARLTLTSDAAKRLDIQTAPVRETQVAQQARKVIPYSAVLYDPQGEAWTFTSPQALTFIRERITVDSVTGNDAVLSVGPSVGTAVVTVGAAELYGAELGLGQ